MQKKIQKAVNLPDQTYWEDKTGRLFALCLALAGAAMALLLIRYYPHFETNDDMAVTFIVNGIKGSHDPHVIIQSTLLGYIYTFFYRLTTQLPWYTLIQYAVLLMSFAVIGYASRRLLGRIAWLFYAALLYIGGYEVYITIQYTKASGMAAAAGTMLLLLVYLGSENVRQKAGMLGASLMLLAFAFMYRENMTVVCMGLFVPPVIGYFLADRREWKEKGKRAAKLIGLVLAVFALLYMGNKLTFRSELWQYFYAFDDPRVQLLDYGMPSFEENEEELEALGIDYTAYNMISNWELADPEVFTPETFNAMVDMKQSVRYLSRAQIKSFLKEVPQTLLQYRMSVLLIAAMLYFLLVGLRSPRSLFLLILSGAFYGGTYYLLYCSGRWAMNRVAVPMMIAQMFSLLLLTRCDTDKPPRTADRVRKYAGAAAMILITIMYVQGSFGRYPTMLRGSDAELSIRNTGKALRSNLKKVAEDEDHFYVTSTGAFIRDNMYGPFDTAEPNLMCGFIQLGGWAVNSQQYVDLCNKEGIDNPMRAGIDDPRIIRADTHINLTCAYLEKHLGIKLRYEEVSPEEISIGSVPLYRLYTDEADE